MPWIRHSKAKEYHASPACVSQFTLMAGAGGCPKSLGSSRKCATLLGERSGPSAGPPRPAQPIGLFIGPGSVCTQTYLVAGPLSSKVEAKSVESYLRTRFARFLVSLRKPSQDVFRSMYRWVPVQPWDRTWTDTDLYKKYGITKDEQAFIESMIRPMAESDE